MKYILLLFLMTSCFNASYEKGDLELSTDKRTELNDRIKQDTTDWRIVEWDGGFVTAKVVGSRIEVTDATYNLNTKQSVGLTAIVFIVGFIVGLIARDGN